jgi:hypothetical protein
MDNHEYESSILWLLKNGLAFIEQYNTIGWKKAYDDRIEEPSFARRACKEASRALGYGLRHRASRCKAK